MSNERQKEDKKDRLRYKSFTAWILVASFAVSFTALIIYLAEASFSDINLYLLLIVLRYSAFIICLCSLHKMIMHIYGIIRHYKFRPKKFVIFLGFFLYGVSIILFEAFISAISGGNI